ncbi:hypothetical protein FCM35_KLT19301 [Carex littledalei]|uniref:Uncharacterized protein n=1 Tax=Carex littledalei TaxID=544730 RepID=A0A833R1C7_9POAL|nr:hypothetical protein FCM35_KLT19301 [Carex littledalei]
MYVSVICVQGGGAQDHAGEKIIIIKGQVGGEESKYMKPAKRGILELRDRAKRPRKKEKPTGWCRRAAASLSVLSMFITRHSFPIDHLTTHEEKEKKKCDVIILLYS